MAKAIKHPTNELIHWICVPVIFGSVLVSSGRCRCRLVARRGAVVNWTLAAMALVTVFYVWLSRRISAGMLFFMAMCYVVIASSSISSPARVAGVRVAFCAGVDRAICRARDEGKKPSFLKDVIFLLISGRRGCSAESIERFGQSY